jgi:hypothetical protein
VTALVPTPADGNYDAFGIAVDAQNVYWAIQGPARGISKISLNGGTVTSLVSGLAQGVDNPIFLAVDNTNVYFSDTPGIMKIPINSSGGTATAFGPSQSWSYAIATDGSNVYWTTANTVSKMSTSGGPSTPIASGQMYPYSIAVDVSNVYWVNYGSTSASDGTVMMAPIGGGSAIPLASGQAQPNSIAVDATYVYWTTSSATNGSVLKVPIAGGTPTTLASGQTNARSIAVDATSAYWTNSIDLGPVMKVTPK